MDPVTGVRQHNPLRHTLGARGLDLVEGDLRFGLEHDVLGHAGSGPANWVGRPILWKIEPKGDRQACMFVGCRQRDQRLADRMFVAPSGGSSRIMRRARVVLDGPARSLTHRGRAMQQDSEVYVGLDTSKLKISVALAEAGRDGEVRFLGDIDSAPEAVERLSSDS
jgi:hypothetical protein